MKRPLKILALVSDAWGGQGGIAQYNRDLLGSWAVCDQVGSIHILPRQAEGLDPTPARVRQASPRPGQVSYSLGALRTALGQSVDVVFCGHVNMAPLAWIIARLKRAVLIVQAHGVEVWEQPTKLRRLAVDAADMVLCVSRHTRSSVLSWATLPPERLVVLPNTVGEDFGPGDRRALKSTLGLGGKRVLLTVGRMAADEREKGHDRVVSILPDLARAGHDVAYVVIGDGDDRARLEALSRDIGVADRVIFLGAAPRETAIRAYRMADLFLMPSKQEGFGIAFLEAMACGTPAIGLAVGGTTDALADGELGVLAGEADLAQVVISELARDRSDRESLAGAVQRRFGKDAFTRATGLVAEQISHLVQSDASAEGATA